MQKPIISIIAAIGKNRELGKNNQLLWKIPTDLKHFKKITTGHPVIMGRKTYESIGKPLPERTNIIISRNLNIFVGADLLVRPNSAAGGKIQVVNSIKEALDLGNILENSGEVFIIGGASIYAQAMPFADKLYLTIIDAARPDADTFFPDYSDFKKIISKEDMQENGIKFSFLELQRTTLPAGISRSG